jgi:hypothetical protein
MYSRLTGFDVHARVQLLLAKGKGNSVIRRLAYDAVAIANLHHEDWVNVGEGLSHDLVPEQVAEVQLRALEMVAALPELHVERLMDDGKLEGRLLAFVNEVGLDISEKSRSPRCCQTPRPCHHCCA